MKSFFCMIFLACLSLSTAAQGNYRIEGRMWRDSLRFASQRITQLYLSRLEEGKSVVVDSATVDKGHFVFSGQVPQHPEIYFITGFDNGSIQLFLEEGTCTILPFDGHFPVGARVKGTPNNEVLFAYQALLDSIGKINIAEQQQLMQTIPDSIRQNAEKFYPYQNANFFSNTFRLKTAAMRFVATYYDKLAALYLMRYELYHLFAPRVVERQLLRSLAPHLQTHPVYHEMLNLVRAAEMKVGSLSPDIEGMTLEGKKLKLSDLKGKYVLLDFWASWCGPCRREFPHMKTILTESEKHNNLQILSFSLDKNSQEWTECIAKNALTHANWLHISDFKAWNSPAVTLMGVKSLPRTVLINPKGQIVAFDLRGEEMVQKLLRIMRGEEKYE